VSVSIVAEIGAAHGGSIDEALRLASLAAECGADVVKGQAGISELTATSHPLHGRFSDLELTAKDWAQVASQCHDDGVGFAVSIWSSAAIYATSPTDDFVKVGSGDATHVPTLEAAIATGLPVYLSTGLCTKAEIDEAVDVLGDALECLMACTVNYPSEVSQSFLGRIKALRDYGVKVGYSSHCLDWRVPFLATELGAEVVEVHFGGDGDTTDEAALTSRDLRNLVKAVRGVTNPVLSDEFRWLAIGEGGGFGVHECEKEWVTVARRDPVTGLRR